MGTNVIRWFFVLWVYVQSSLCVAADNVLGHMLPLGSHRDPENVEERYDIPSAKEFFEKYVIPSKAVVLRGVVKDSPIFHKWTDEYLVEKYPHFELRLEAKTEKEGYVPMGEIGMGRDTLRNFIDNYHNTNKYIVSELPTPAWHEVLVPSFMTCGPLKQNMVEIDLWMSGGNTSSLLHKDAFNTMNCLFNGTKEWKLFEYKYESSLYKAYEAGDPKGGFSRINPESVDLKKYPKVATVPWSFTTVNKGDCLFLPKSMYHQVKSFGTMNTAVAILFSRFEKIDPSKQDFIDCPSDFLPLSKIDVDWQYPGKGQMFMGYPELAEIREGLRDIVNKNTDNLYQTIVDNVDLKDFHPLNATEKAGKLLTLLQDGDLHRNITRSYIDDLPRRVLRQTALLTEPLIPSNTYEYELFQISPREIAELLSILVKKGNGIVERKSFVTYYQERLWGSKNFGNLFFDDLAGKGNERVTKEDIVKNFYIAAKKFDKRELVEEEGENDDDENSENQGDDTESRDEDEENKEEDGQNQEEDGENQEEDGENQDDDAYIGRNVDLSEEKDRSTLKDLARQIVDGSFTDSDLNVRAIRRKKDSQTEDEEKKEEDETGDGMEEMEEYPRKKAQDSGPAVKDEL